MRQRDSGTFQMAGDGQGGSLSTGMAGLGRQRGSRVSREGRGEDARTGSAEWPQEPGGSGGGRRGRAGLSASRGDSSFLPSITLP